MGTTPMPWTTASPPCRRCGPARAMSTASPSPASTAPAKDVGFVIHGADEPPPQTSVLIDFHDNPTGGYQVTSFATTGFTFTTGDAMYTAPYFGLPLQGGGTYNSVTLEAFNAPLTLQAADGSSFDLASLRIVDRPSED